MDLRFDDPAVSRLAGEIRATDDHWQLTNHSTTHGYLVENPEGAGEYLRVPPRRVGAPIPFEFARVVLPARGPAVAFQVFAPRPRVPRRGRPGGGGQGTRTLTAYSLDETAAYSWCSSPCANRGCGTSPRSPCRPPRRSWSGSGTIRCTAA